MSIIKYRVEVNVLLDTEEYPVPADGQIALSLKEEVSDLVESNLTVEVLNVKVTRTGGVNAEVRDRD